MTKMTQHLQDVDETYFQHLRHAMGFAISMFIGSLACLIHALFPFLCVTSGSNAISRLHDQMVRNRRRQ